MNHSLNKQFAGLLVGVFGLTAAGLVWTVRAAAEAAVVDAGKEAKGEPWKWRGWSDKSRRLPEIEFDGLPLSDVSRNLQEVYDYQFDVIPPEALGPKEIAEPMGATPKAVSSRLEQLRARLRQSLLRRLSNEDCFPRPGDEERLIIRF